MFDPYIILHQYASFEQFIYKVLLKPVPGDVINVAKYKRSYPGKTIITKQSLSKVLKEEMRNI